jgi:hypothetical protein
MGRPGVLGLFSGTLVIAAGLTLLIPETKGKSLEEIEVGDIYGAEVVQDVERLDGGKSASTVTSMKADG